MKNKKTITIIVIICLCLGFALIFTKNNDNITIKETKNCDKLPKLYYTFQNQKIYTYCLDSIMINDKDKKQELKDYMKEDPTIIEKIIEQMKQKDIYKDGGTKKYTNHTITVIKCNKIMGSGHQRNTDIYIGNRMMGYEEGFCEGIE